MNDYIMNDHITKMSYDNDQLKEIQESPNYLKIVKYTDNMSYESMLLALINNDKKINQVEINNIWKQKVKMPYDDIDQTDQNKLKITENLFDLPKLDDTPESSFGHWPSPNCNFFYCNDKPFTFGQQYYDFKNTHGISSTQNIIKKINSNDNELIKLIDNYWQMKICRIKGTNYDALTNINISIFSGLNGDATELILKINNNIICSKFIQNNVTDCEFIKFPNFILNCNPSQQKEQKVELFIRGKNHTIYNSKFSFDIKYDVILFDMKSRSNIFTFCNNYIFKNNNGIICQGLNGVYAVKYMSQLIETIPDEFKC